MITFATLSKSSKEKEHTIKQVEQKQTRYNNKRTGEPGIKEPTASYKQIGQVCDSCQDVYTHFLDIHSNKMMCSKCGKVSKVGESTQDVLLNIISKKKVEVYYSLFNLFI